MADDRCAGCGFVYDLGRCGVAADDIEGLAEDLAGALEGGASARAALRTRPEPETWSPLEYACHVRDVLLVQRERILAARRLDTPRFEPMGRDERVEHDGYRDQDPADVARQVRDAARLLANVLRRLPPEDWDRTAIYTYPAEMVRSLAWVAVHTVHEMTHHLQDLRRPLEPPAPES